MCDPVTYLLLFPDGEDGWHVNMLYTTTTRQEREEVAAAAMDVGDDEVFGPLLLDERLQALNAALPAATDDALEDEPEPEPEEEIDNNKDDPQRLNRGTRKQKRVTQCEF